MAAEVMRFGKGVLGAADGLGARKKFRANDVGALHKSA